MPNGQWPVKEVAVAVISLVLGFGGGTVSRTDPFTGKDAVILEQKIRHDMPPEKTRQRIRELEAWATTQGYRKQTYGWQ